MKKNVQQMIEWRKLTRSALLKQKRTLEDELTKKRFQVSLQKEKNTASLKGVRKSIARVETILHEEIHA